MISLFGIFPLLYWKTIPVKEQFDQRVMNVYLPKEGDYDGTLATMFSEGFVLKDVVTKQQTAFYLNDFIEQRANVLEAIRSTGREIKYGNDTKRVVKVVFGENCSFNDLVSVLNICLADEHKRYAWVQDTIFIFSSEPPAPEQYFSGCNLLIECVKSPEKEWYTKALTFINENGLFLLAFMVLLFFSGWYQITKTTSIFIKTSR
jgi:hypothetical protein